MAKKAKATKKSDGEAAKPSETLLAIPASKLKSLMKRKRSTVKDVAELTGTMAQAIADAVENDHLNRSAFAVICRLDRMEPEKLADWLDHFDHMLDASGLLDRAKQVQRLGLGDEKEDDEDEDEAADDKAPKNVTRFPPPASAAAE